MNQKLKRKKDLKFQTRAGTNWAGPAARRRAAGLLTAGALLSATHSNSPKRYAGSAVGLDWIQRSLAIVSAKQTPRDLTLARRQRHGGGSPGLRLATARRAKDAAADGEAGRGRIACWRGRNRRQPLVPLRWQSGNSGTIPAR